MHWALKSSPWGEECTALWVSLDLAVILGPALVLKTRSWKLSLYCGPAPDCMFSLAEMVNLLLWVALQP